MNIDKDKDLNAVTTMKRELIKEKSLEDEYVTAKLAALQAKVEYLHLPRSKQQDNTLHTSNTPWCCGYML